MGSPLLAKTPGNEIRDEDTLAGHCRRVYDSAKALLSKLHEPIQKRFQINRYERLAKAVSIAALIHDLGKASDLFQASLKGETTEKHPFYHELVTLTLVHGDTELGQWLRTNIDEGTLYAVSTLVAGHHLRMRGDVQNPRRKGMQLNIFMDDPSLHDLWSKLQEMTKTNQEFTRYSNKRLGESDMSQTIGEFLLKARGRLKASSWTPLELSVGKALLICADILGSSQFEGGLSPQDVVHDRLAISIDGSEIQEVVDEKLDGHDPYPFQREVADSNQDVTVVTAGCGNGKTVAAYMWGKRKAQGQRLVFCYPTTGTTTAGFKEYLMAPSSLERKTLLHSRAEADIEHIQEGSVSGEKEQRDTGSSRDLWAKDALDLWSTKVVSCTVDSVLGLLGFWRQSISALPVWANSVFVFDEIHAYDSKLFGGLLAFLKHVDAPTLLMTASLSTERKRALEQVTDEDIDPITGNPEIENASRYKVEMYSSFEETKRSIQSTLNENGNVLVVANTVSRSRDRYKQLRNDLDVEAFLYHSRFRYRDRVQRQEEVIDSFREEGPALVVSTQVCEMSLDISADLLVTDVAPFPSLVQRMGRLNREPIPVSPKTVVAVETESALPYDQDQLEKAKTHLQDMKGDCFSQRDLAERLDTIQEGQFEEEKFGFTADTVETKPEPIRNLQHGITVVREPDLNKEATAVSGRELTKLEIPMTHPNNKDPETWQRVKGVPVAPESELNYSEETGAKWAN